MTEDGKESLRDHIMTNAEGARQKMAEGNLLGAYEELLVGHRLSQMALKTSPGQLTPERVELVSRMAWAESELMRGRGTRVPDDLEGVSYLSKAVRAQDFADSDPEPDPAEGPTERDPRVDGVQGDER